jgi:co-chaperonin GroES (HSP10)
MNTIKDFIVSVPKRINDTIVTDSGLELYLDTRFDEFTHRNMCGEVAACPIKNDTGVKEGDTLYFHHHVVINGGQKIDHGEDLYLVRYSASRAVENQCIAYKDKETEKIFPMAGWTLLIPHKEEAKKESEIIEVVKLEEDPYVLGEVAFESEELQDMGVKKGDIVGFKKNRDYEVSIESVSYFRVRTEDLLYVKI